MRAALVCVFLLSSSVELERAERGRGRWRHMGAAVGKIQAESGWSCGGCVHRGRPFRDRRVVGGGRAVGWSVRTVRRGRRGGGARAWMRGTVCRI
jgi:hypothetical protein